MKFAFLNFVFLILVNASTAQVKNDSLSIGFRLKKSVANLPEHLDLLVITKNIVKESVLVYRSLTVGRLNDNLVNFHVVIEQLVGKKYEPIWINQGVGRRDAHSFDSLRHFDLPKYSLEPNDSDTLIFSLLNIHSFEKGKYRVKAFLRVSTIPNNQEYIDKNFESEPPSDQLIYLQSDWLNFEVKTRLQRKRIGLE